MSYFIPKGYKIEEKVKSLRTKDGEVETTLIEVSNKRRKIVKLFGDMKFAIKYIQTLESEKVEKKALSGKGAASAGNFAILTASNDLKAAKELAGEYDDLTNDEINTLVYNI